MNKELIPQLRFKKFSSKWNKVKLKDIGLVQTGNTPSTSNKDFYEESGMLWVTPSDIINNSVASTSRRLSVQGQNVARVVPKGSILCTCIASIGKNCIANETCAFNQQINSLTPDFDNYDTNYLFFNSFLWSKTMKASAGSLTFQIVNKTEFEGIDTFITKDINEQIQIGQCLDKINNDCIDLEKKYIKLQQLKSALLYKMFPNDENGLPEVRFKDFREPFETKKLGENGEFASNGVDKKINLQEKIINLLNYMDVYKKKSISAKNCNELMQVTATETQINTNNVLANDIFFTPTSETADDIGHVSVITEDLPNTCYSYHLMRYRPKQNIFYSSYPNYGFECKFVRKQLIYVAQGVQRFVIGKKDFENIKVLVPKKMLEQEKISKLFCALDKLINLYIIKHTKLEQLKEAMLNKMFVQ